MSPNQPIKFCELKSGRSIAIRYLIEGDPNKCVFLCHPTPGVGTLIPNLEETVKRGATLIGIDRAGYGQSNDISSDHWISVSEAAEDVAEILDNVATEPVGLVGWSLGGWVALALAANRPDLVDRLAIIGTPAPENEQPWLFPELKQALDNYKPSEKQLVIQNLQNYLNSKPVIEIGRTLLGISDADADILALPDVENRLTSMIEEAFTQGHQGLSKEIAGFNLLEWGFKPSDVKAKTLCLYGSKDPIAAHRHGSWWQKQLPDARLEMSPKVGHLLIFPMWKRVLSHLFPRQRRKKK